MQAVSFPPRPIVGFPPRPVSSGIFTGTQLGKRDIATPKLNGMRVLIPRGEVAVYNRHGKPFTKMNTPTNAGDTFLPELHRHLCKYSHESVEWWDLEYLPVINAAVVIDVCERTFERDYHARRRLLREKAFTPANPIGDLTDMGRQRICMFPVYHDNATALHWWRLMEAHYKHIGNGYLWEGLVAVDTTLPYMLTRKQSMNMEMHRKYKFR